MVMEPKPRSTMVGVTLICEVPGWVVGRLLYKMLRRKRVDEDLDKMLTQFKRAVEVSSVTTSL